MKLKPKYLPYISLALGIPALLLRIWLFTTGIDEKGLLSVTHPANALSYILAALGIGLLAWAALPLKEPVSGGKLFHPSIPACIGSGLAGLGILYTTASELFQKPGTVALITCLFGIPAALCIVVSSLLRQKRRTHYLLHAFFAIYLILHILSQYQAWNIDPQLQNYFPQLLASVFLMITAYYRAVLDTGKVPLRLFAFFNYGALLFCCLSVCSSSPVFYLSLALWTATADCKLAPAHPKAAPMMLPEDVLYCIRTLKKGGHSAYVVGGCVRDHLLGITPHDYDLCTSAKPEEICELFQQHTLVHAGQKHGTIGVVIQNNVYEITTYRTEDGYSDNRHPDQVTFVRTIQEDLARRDFTVNAMAYTPEGGFVDPFGGLQDLKNGVLRAVGDPETRFREDSLRILRGIRFAARFHLEIEEQTMLAMLRCVQLTDNLARERVFTELCGLLPHVNAQDLVRYSPILSQVIPELAPTIGFQQHNPHHTYDVYSHIAHTVEAAPQDITLRMAALFHDIGKPHTYTEDENGIGHFYGHEKRSAEMADEILHRLKAPNAFRERVVRLVENHMVLFDPDIKLLRRRVRQHGEEALAQMLSLQKADMIATGTRTADDLVFYDEVAQLLETIRKEDGCLHTKDLAVNGEDLLALGFQPGPQLGQCLEKLLDAVVDETLPNEKDRLLDEASKYL